MEQFNFEVTTDLSVINPTKISCNFEETRAWLENALAPYESLVVTEDAISDAKSIKANINRVKKAINDQKVSVKKAWMSPFEQFENDCKTLMGMCDSAASNIDVQVKEYEQKKKDEKIATIKAVFDSEATHLTGYLNWNDVNNPRFALAGFKLNDAIAEVRNRITETDNDLETIRGMDSEFEASLLEEYCRTHDIRSALAKEKTLRELQEREFKLKEQKDETTRVEQPQAQIREPEPPTAKETAYAEPQRPQKVYELSFKVYVTKNQMYALKDFFENNGIEYAKIV